MRRITWCLLVAIAAISVMSAAAVPVAAAPNTLRVTPGTVSFGAKHVGSLTFKSATVTNASAETIDLIVTVERE